MPVESGTHRPTNQKVTPLWGSICFYSFEEEDDSPAHRYRIRANARRHAANHVGNNFPQIFSPSHSPTSPPLHVLASSGQPPEVVHPPAPSTYRWLMRSSIQPLAQSCNAEAFLHMMKHSPRGTDQRRMNLDASHKELVETLKSRTPYYAYLARPYLKEKQSRMALLWLMNAPSKSKYTVSDSSWVGNLIQYPSEFSTRSADITASKCMWTSTIPAVGAKCICHEVHKGMYGSPQAGILAHQLPVICLAVHGYNHTKFITGLW
jgi:hypothetical protein